MRYRLEVTNFQSLKDISIEFHGFTTICGESNRGKSAMMRALDALINNQWRSDYLRRGEKESRIRLTFLDHPEVKHIERIRGKSNTYRVLMLDGIEHVYEKAGGASPPDLVSRIFANRLDTNRGDSYDLIMQSQLAPMFLVGGSEVANASLLSTLFRVDRFEAATRNCRADLARITQSLKASQDSLGPLRDEQKGLQERYDALCGVYARYLAIQKQFIEKSNLLARVVAFRDNLSILRLRVDEYQTQHEIAKKASEAAPSLDAISEALRDQESRHEICTSLRAKARSRDQIQDSVDTLSPIGPTFEMLFNALSSDLEKKRVAERVRGAYFLMGELERNQKALSNTISVVSRVDMGFSSYVDTARLRSLGVSAEELSKSMEVLKEALSFLAGMDDLDQSHVEYLACIEFHTCLEREQLHQLEIEQKREMLNEITEGQEAILSAWGRCPLCNEVRQ